MNLVGGGEMFDPRHPARIRDYYFVTRAVRFGSHFALNRLAPALEEVEHAADYCTAEAVTTPQLNSNSSVGIYASVEAYSSYVPLKSVS